MRARDETSQAPWEELVLLLPLLRTLGPFSAAATDFELALIWPCFLEEPLQSLTGYLMALSSIFLRAAFPKSTPHMSDSLTRYRSTSESSSPKWTFSSSSQSGSPLGTSPFHWNISDSSPTSPTYIHQNQTKHPSLHYYPSILLVTKITSFFLVSGYDPSSVGQPMYSILFLSSVSYPIKAITIPFPQVRPQKNHNDQKHYAPPPPSPAYFIFPGN